MFVLHALGSNGSGQLGIGHKEDVSAPEPVHLPDSLSNPRPKLKQITAGGNHTLLLFQSGDLLWSGDHTTGACGPVNSTSGADSTELPPRFRPVDLTSLPPGSKPSFISATWNATVVITSGSSSSSCHANSVYTFGTGQKGELGLGPNTTHTSLPTLVRDFPPPQTHIIDISSCMGHVVAVLSNGEAWGWGNGRKGQLGEPAASAIFRPRRIEGVKFRVVKAVCGREFTVLFGPPESGNMTVLGSDKWGVQSQAPSSSSPLGGVTGWKEAGAGWGSVFVLKADGALLSWGRDDHGQLAPNDLGRVRHIAVGSEHAAALTEESELIIWGWGEHGNCGPLRNEKGGKGEKGECNKIATAVQGMDITVISAGCATTWIGFEKQT
ncbi:regulator of chromosome condensation 1/beta-lactamase-inhibitor protein II [Corynascus similis CBS 632.67]